MNRILYLGWVLAGLGWTAQVKADTTDSLTVVVEETEWEGNLKVTLPPITVASAIGTLTVDKDRNEVSVYDMKGQQPLRGIPKGEVPKDLPKGIYIVNGHKVIVK